MTLSNSRFSIFISGETIDLCVPNIRAIKEDGWTDWFNKVETLKATQHGIFPNYETSQLSFLESLPSDKTKIVLLICEKITNKAVGVISLKEINFQKRSAKIAINVSSRSGHTIHPLSSLEAMALITQHGFEELGMLRIYGDQAYPLLLSWNKLLELIGFKPEGITRKSFVRGSNVQDSVLIACHFDFFMIIKQLRGSLWGSSKEIRKLIKRQPKISYAEQLDKKLFELDSKHFDYIFNDK